MLNVFEFKPGAKGLYSLNATGEIPMDGLLDSTNCRSQNGQIVPTIGFETHSVIGGSSDPVAGLYTAIKSDGATRTFATKADGLFWLQSIGPVVWTEIGALTFTSRRQDFATINDFAVLVDRNVAPQKIVLGSPPTVGALGGSPPTGARYVLEYKGRLLLFNVTGAFSGLYWSAAGLPETWPVGNSDNIGFNDGDIGIGMYEYQGLVYLIKTRSIWAETTGDFGNPRFEKVTPSGTLSVLGSVKTPHGIIVHTERGLMLFDGNNLNPLDTNVPLSIRDDFGPLELFDPTEISIDLIALDYIPGQDVLKAWPLGREWNLDMRAGTWSRNATSAVIPRSRGAMAWIDAGKWLFGALSATVYSRGDLTNALVQVGDSMVFQTPHIPLNKMPSGESAEEAFLWDVWVKITNGTGSDQTLTLSVYRDKATAPETYPITVSNTSVSTPTKWLKIANTPGLFRELSLKIEVTLPASGQTISGSFGNVAVTDLRIRWSPVGQTSEPR